MGKELTTQTDLQSTLLEVVRRDDIDPDRLEKFLDLQIKMEERQSEKEFNSALAGFQIDCPVIKKTKHVKFKAVDYWYAPLDEIVSIIKPILNKHGLSYTFNMFEMEASSHAELVTTIYHVGGHKKSFRYHFDPIHDDARMNLSQRRKSAITFAKREGLESALGMVTAGQDDDARRAIDEMATEKQLEMVDGLLEVTGTEKEKLFNYLQVNLETGITRFEADKAIHALKQKKAKNVQSNKL